MGWNVWLWVLLLADCALLGYALAFTEREDKRRRNWVGWIYFIFSFVWVAICPSEHSGATYFMAQLLVGVLTMQTIRYKDKYYEISEKYDKLKPKRTAPQELHNEFFADYER